MNTIVETSHEETKWWHTVLHILVFPIALTVINLFTHFTYLIALGPDIFDGLWVHITMTAASVFGGLYIPLIVLKHSNETVVASVIGTLMCLLTLFVCWVVFTTDAEAFSNSTWGDVKSISIMVVALLAVIAFAMKDKLADL